VQKGWRASQQEVRRIAIQILEILVYLHELTPPVTHRDIKPSNIIRHPDGQVFLVDFGAVQDTYYNTFMRGSTVVGTYGYMAPEQFRGQSVPATDLYGLAATLLFLLTHRSPADLPTDGLKLDFRSHVQIPEEFADWLEKMLEPDVEDRFPSAKESLAVLRGKQMITTKSGASFPWKPIVGVGIAAVAAVSVLNSYKWSVLGSLGFKPPTSLCENANAMRNYVNQGGNPNAVVHYVFHKTIDFDIAKSMLECAASNGYKDVAELLIAKGADVNALSKGGTTPLHVVRSLEMAQLLIASGADVNALAKDGSTPLHVVASPAVAQSLIAKGADDKPRKGEYGYTPLHVTDSLKVAQFLIANGADVNALDADGNTALHVAGSQQVAQLLIAKGADVRAKNENGSTPLHKAAASYNSKKEIVELLIASGADVNALGKNGMTPLHWAAESSNKEVVKVLLAKGADVNAKAENGTTPLHKAIQLSNKDVMELLIASGADVSAKGENGMTPLHLAVQSHRKNTIALLVTRGADVNAKLNNGMTPLHWAITNHLKDAIVLMIAHGADVNAKNNNGDTPLSLAAKYNSNVLELLKSHGAK
jgi:ankyrin repeat protein